MSRGTVVREAQPLISRLDFPHALHAAEGREGTDDVDSVSTELAWRAPDSRVGSRAEAANLGAFAAADKVLMYDVCSESSPKLGRRSSTHAQLMDMACISFSGIILSLTGVDVNCCSQKPAEDFQYVEDVTQINAAYASAYVRRSDEADPDFFAARQGL